MKFYSEQFSPFLKEFFKDNYSVEIDSFDFVKTRDGFDGDITMLVFPLQNKVDNDLESLSEEIGSFLVGRVSWVCDFNIVKGLSHESESGPIAHIPPFFGKFEISKNINLFKLKLLCLYAGHKPANDFDEAGVDNIDETPLINTVNGEENWAGSPGWWTLSFYIKYKINNSFDLQIGCDNILDAHYKTFGSGVSAPGRNLIFAINYSF